MIKQKLTHIDMDGVLCDFSSAYKDVVEKNSEIIFPQSLPGFFENLLPIEGAIHSFKFLSTVMDVYILSAPSVHNPLCYTEKRLWVEEHLGFEYVHKLILSSNKGLLKGDFLIDDYVSGRGQETFEGELIQFGSDMYPDWKAIVNYLT